MEIGRSCINHSEIFMIVHRGRSLRRWLMRTRKLRLAAALAASVSLAISSSAWGQTTWTGAGGDDLWFNNVNWNTIAPNSITIDVIVGGPSPTVVNGNVNINSLDVGAAGVVTLNNNFSFNFGGTAATTLFNAGTINSLNNTDLQLARGVNNSGSINVSNAGNPTDLEVIADGATLTGGGTITLGGTTNNSRIVGLVGSPTLTIDDQIIQGHGQLGVNTLVINNQANGLIDANSVGNLLTIDPSAGGMTNTGTMRASGGGILQLSAGSVNNAGGLIEAQNGSTVRLTNSTVIGGTLSSSGTGLISVEASTNSFLENLTIVGNMETENNTDLGLTGTINNTGSITVTNIGNVTDIEIQAAGAILTGGGTITLQGTTDSSRIMGVGGSTLTVANQTIQGRGQLGANSIGIVNQTGNLIDANSSGNLLTIDPSAAGMTNQGTLRASNGGIVVLTGNGGGAFTNTNGMIEALEGSEVQLTGGVSISEGTLTSTGTGLVRVNVNQDVFLNDLTHNGQMMVENNVDLGFSGTINNTGSITVVNAGNLTDIEIQAGGATLTGGGTITLQGSNNNSRIDGVAGGPTLTIADQTIQGHGNIGANTIGILNQTGNLIDANSTTVSSLLTIDPSSAGNMTNQGTMRASNGGTLQLTGNGGGDFDNAGGLIEAQTGSTVRLTNATVVGGVLSTSGTGLFSVDDNTNSFLENLTFSGNMNVLNNTDLGLSGTINNTGSISIINVGNPTDIHIQTGGATLTGGGTITLQGTTNNSRIDGVAGSPTLTIANQTIQGHGNIGTNSIGILNQTGNLIDANSNAVGSLLTIDPSNAGNMTNQGTMRASNGGTLQLTGNGGGDFNNAGGLIEAQTGSTVRLTNATVVGGVLSTSGTGLFSVDSSTNSFLENLTFSGNMDVLNNTDLGFSGTINNTGSISVANIGNITNIEIQTGGASLTGGGTITLQGSNNNSRIDGVAGSPTLTIADQTIQGRGQIGTNTLGIVNGANGVIHANSSGNTLTLDPSSVGNFENQGTLRASGGGELLLTGSGNGGFSGGGTYEALDGGLLRADSTAVLSSVAGGTITEGTWRAIDSGNGATIRLQNNAIVPPTTIGANATVELSGASSAFTFNVANSPIDNSLNNVQGSLILRDSRVMNLSGGLSNSGDILLDGASTTLNVAGNFAQTDGMTQLASGSTLDLDDNANNFFSGGLLAGNGTVDGSFTLGSGAVLSPGLSPGQINVIGDFTWEAGGLIEFDLGSDSFSSDLVSIQGDFLKDGAGSWAFAFIDNGMVAGNTYDLINFSNITTFDVADFSFTNNSPFDGNFAFVNGGQTLQFNLTAVPEPGTGVVLLLSTLSLVMRRRRS